MPSSVYPFKAAGGGDVMVPCADRFDNFSKAICIKVLRLLLLFFPALAVGLVWRLIANGQHQALLPYSALYAAIGALYISRSALSGRTLISALSTVLTSGSLVGFSQVGLASGGPYLFFVALMIAGILEPRRLRIIALAALLLPVVAIFLLAISGISIPMPENVEMHLTSPANWILLGTLLLLTGLIAYTVASESRRVMSDYQATLRLGIVNSMVTIARHRDNETGAHLERCSRYARVLLDAARSMCIDGAESIDLDDMSEAVRLHDIGKVAIPDSILLKPGPLSSDEFKLMSQHAMLGGDLIAEFTKKSGLLDEKVLLLAEEVARFHHENWDGNGYPNYLCSAAIPLSARIMAIIDTYDALRSTRPYKPSWPHDETVAEMQNLAGTKFDPALFYAFEKVHTEFAHIYDDLVDPA